jgi:hypothetical protein
MTLQLLHSEFPYIWGKFDFLFISVVRVIGERKGKDRELIWNFLANNRLPPTLKKNYGTHVIKLDIAPVAFPVGQHLFISASNNMFYRHSQWDKRHTICVVNLMPQDTKIEFLNRSCLGSNLQSSGWVSDTLPVCHMCFIQIFWNWIYLELNIFLAFIQPVF